VFYLKKNRMAWRHAPFDKKTKRGAMYCRCALFHFFKRSDRKIAWLKGDNSSELSNFDAIVKIKKMPTADRIKRKREEMRKAEAASCRNLMIFFSRYI
jgi:hypothetical protein